MSCRPVRPCAAQSASTSPSTASAFASGIVGMCFMARSTARSLSTPVGRPLESRSTWPPGGSPLAGMSAAKSSSALPLTQQAWPLSCSRSTGAPGKSSSRSRRLGKAPPGHFVWSQPKPWTQPPLAFTRSGRRRAKSRATRAASAAERAEERSARVRRAASIIRCACESVSPGTTVAPWRSTTCKSLAGEAQALRSTAWSSPTAAMRSPSTQRADA
mmetsp:Transcript_1560/g.4723  ORF Transcript_1560/g.4723 Transcript_1560/m.4723 type:complete len:216 (-) Transcript_1560:176-823(-)